MRTVRRCWCSPAWRASGARNHQDRCVAKYNALARTGAFDPFTPIRQAVGTASDMRILLGALVARKPSRSTAVVARRVLDAVARAAWPDQPFPLYRERTPR